MDRRQRLTLIATIVGSGVVILDGTIVNLALPKIAVDLHAGFADLQWITDGYLLSLSALILLGGSLGDILGRKKVYQIGLAGFGLVSLLCGLAPNAISLIVLRIIQGIFGALLVPGGLAIINTNFAADKRGSAIGSWSAWGAIFAPIGPLLGGYLLDAASWRWIFFINVPLILLCLFLSITNVQESHDDSPRHLDFPGVVLAALALAGITFGLIEGPARHWGVMALVPLIIGVILSLVFLRVESRAKDPMVSLKLFKSRNFTAANLMTFMLYGALAGFLFAFIIYLQTRVHYSAIAAGMSILPLPIGLFLLSRRFGALSAKIGPRIFMSVGPIIVGLGILLLLPLNAGSHYVTNILPGLLLFAFGMSLVVAPLTITVMSSVSDRSSGIASGINNAVSRASGLIVIALLGLFGTAEVYRFSIWLCGLMAISAGIISWFMVEKISKSKLQPTGH